MSIPTKSDADLASISNIADTVLLTVRAMQRSAQKDRAKMRARLRDLLEQYVAAVKSAAPR
jgi:hypothetical protein